MVIFHSYVTVYRVHSPFLVDKNILGRSTMIDSANPKSNYPIRSSQVGRYLATPFFRPRFAGRSPQYDQTYPIGSMYAIYGNIYHQYTPVMLAYIPYMDPMGMVRLTLNNVPPSVS